MSGTFTVLGLIETVYIITTNLSEVIKLYYGWGRYEYRGHSLNSTFSLNSNQ